MFPRAETADPASAGGVARWRGFVLTAAVLSIVCVHGPILGYKMFANVDEAYATALGERLLEGHKLYQGAISQRGPLMYYLFEGFAWLHGWDNVLALRVWALILAFAHIALVYWAGKTLISKNAATVAVAVTAYALSFGYPPEDAAAINGEPLQLPAMMVGVVLGALAVRCLPGSRARLVRLVGCGLAFGIAVSIKQSVLLHPVPVLLYLAVDAHRRRVPRCADTRRGAPWGRVLGEMTILGAATLAVPGAFLAHAAAEGTLKDLIYYCFTYNSQVHLNPSPKHFIWLGVLFFRLAGQTLFFIVTLFLATRAAPWVMSRVKAAFLLRSPWALTRGFGNKEYIGLHFVLALVAASAMYRFFPHYYLQAAPFMALSVGAALEGAFRRASAARARAQVGALAGFVLASAILGCYFGEKIDGRVAHDRTANDAAKYIEATTKPSDRIFVWGFSPWIYAYAHRRPAGRYVFETYVTGFVPWFWEKLSLEKSRVVPGSMEALLGDLDREDPVVVVDAGSYMMARPMRTYAQSSAWLHEHYCFEVRIGAHDIYRKRPGQEFCVQQHFPKPHFACDWHGMHVPAPIPVAIDQATARNLPRGSYLKPIWFLDGPTPPGLGAIRDKNREQDEAEGSAEGFWVESIEENAPQ